MRQLSRLLTSLHARLHVISEEDIARKQVRATVLLHSCTRRTVPGLLNRLWNCYPHFI